jgi:hypothetical protein
VPQRKLIKITTISQQHQQTRKNSTQNQRKQTKLNNRIKRATVTKQNTSNETKRNEIMEWKKSKQRKKATKKTNKQTNKQSNNKNNNINDHIRINKHAHYKSMIRIVPQTTKFSLLLVQHF